MTNQLSVSYLRGFLENCDKKSIHYFSYNAVFTCVYPGGGGVLGLRTHGEVPLENLKSYPVPESNS